MTAARKFADPKYSRYLQDCESRRQAIRASFEKTGNLSETARAFGITRQRAAQIVTGKRSPR